MRNSTRRASNLLRWYPRTWRLAHGDEFGALLEDSLSERPFWPHRSFDVACTGITLRLRLLRPSRFPTLRLAASGAGSILDSGLGIARLALRRTAVSLVVILGVTILAFAFTGSLRS
jgi:hypothetical protein